MNTSFYFGIIVYSRGGRLKYLIIIGVILILVSTLFIIIKNTKSKFLFLDIKLKEGENNISLFLQKKKDIMDKIVKIVIQNEKYKDSFDEFNGDVNNQSDNFKLHSVLNDYYNKLSKIIFEDDTIVQDEKLVNLLNELKDNEEDLIGAIKFFNDTVVDYNKLIVVFPHKIIAKVLGYTEEQFYKNEKEEMFQILK